MGEKKNKPKIQETALNVHIGEVSCVVLCQVNDAFYFFFVDILV